MGSHDGITEIGHTSDLVEMLALGGKFHSLWILQSHLEEREMNE